MKNGKKAVYRICYNPVIKEVMEIRRLSQMPWGDLWIEYWMKPYRDNQDQLQVRAVLIEYFAPRKVEEDLSRHVADHVKWDEEDHVVEHSLIRHEKRIWMPTCDEMSLFGSASDAPSKECSILEQAVQVLGEWMKQHPEYTVNYGDLVLYHVTRKSYLPSIMEHGLVPMKGPLTQMTDDLERVYLFRALDEEFERDVNQWLVLGHPRSEMVLLKVTIPYDFSGLQERYGWEMLCYKTIPAEYIEVMEYDFMKK